MDQVVENANALTAQMKKLFLSDSSADIRLVNNYDWTKDLTLLDFLRDFGKNFNINTMLAKDIVASRLGYRYFFHGIHLPDSAVHGLPAPFPE
jgi:tyrosyl-tRNA synthetase